MRVFEPWRQDASEQALRVLVEQFVHLRRRRAVGSDGHAVLLDQSSTAISVRMPSAWAWFGWEWRLCRWRCSRDRS